MTDIVHVAVAVIMNQHNQICISLRNKDAHQGNLWEFPGGKIKQSETVEQALKREIKEELNLSIEASRPLIKINHSYSDVSVCLHVQKIQSYSGQAKSMEGQLIKWVDVSQLSNFDFPVANIGIIKAIQLPEYYLITGEFVDQKDFILKLGCALKKNIRLVQLRLKNENLAQVEDPQKLIDEVSIMCKQVNASLLLNLSEQWKKMIEFKNIPFSGFHLDSKSLMQGSKYPEDKIFSASCHNKKELEKALQLKADFVVLSPVQKTASHPDMIPIGWDEFSQLIENIDIPVYALGGVSADDLEIAQNNGAQGIAAISALWNGNKPI